VIELCTKYDINRTYLRPGYSDLNVWNMGANPHLGFHGSRTSILARPPRTYNALTFQIWAKSNNLRRSYYDLKFENLGADPIPTLKFKVDEFESLHRFCRPIMRTHTEFQRNSEQSKAQL